MAPLIKATVHFLLGYSQTQIAQQATEPCFYPQDDTIGASKALAPSISAISWGYNRLDVFATDKSSGFITHKYWDGYQWGPSVSDLENLGGDFTLPPSAISDDPGRMDIFVAAKDGSLQHKYYDGNNWRPSPEGWDNLTLPVGAASHLSTTSWAPGRLDCFWKDTNGALKLKYYNAPNWGPSEAGAEDLGGEMTSDPAAVSWGPNRNDVFAIDHGKLLHLYWDGSGWSGWAAFIQGKFKEETPRAVSWGVNRLDIFAVNTKGSLSHLYWDGSQWSNLEELGGTSLVGTVAATASPNRLDIVALAADGHYYYKFYDGASWQPSVEGWYDKGGNFSSAPSVVSWTKDANQRFDIFGVTSDGELAHQTWYGSGWYPGVDQWETLGKGLAA